MATILKGRKKGGQGSLKGGKEGTTYSETYMYTVISDIANESYWNVITTSGLPVVMVTETVEGLKCMGIDATQDTGSPYVWHVTAEFSAETTGQDTGSDPDPKTWIPIWTGTVETYDAVLHEAPFATTATGTIGSTKPYVNSANCKFPEPLIRRKPISVSEFTQYEDPDLTIDEIVDRNDNVNDDEFKGFAKRSLKITVKSYTKGIYFGYLVWKINYGVA